MIKFLAVSVILSVAGAQQPGQCKTTADSAKYGDDFTCIAVQTSFVGITLASQCVLGGPCTGNKPGKCPTFSSWSTNYQKIQPVCAFAPADNCEGNELNNETVTCYQTSFNINNETVNVTGIYKCIDSVMYVEKNYGAIKNLTDSQMENCAGDSNTQGSLCNGHGTCAPTSPFSPIYKCICNSGYSDSDNCFKAISNNCDNFGSCGTGNTCDTNSKSCTCTGGTTGNQCSLCDSTAEQGIVCNGNGQCSTDGICTCNNGYSGSLCTKYNPNATGSGSDSKNDASSHATIHTLMAIITMVITFVM